MSHSDSFIDEVTEEVRRDRLFRLFRRWGWVGILAIILIVGGSAIYEWRQSQQEQAAREFGDALSTAMQAEAPADRLAALEKVTSDGAGRVALRDMLAAQAAEEAGKKDEALKLLDSVAANADLSPELRQLALLKRVILAGPDMEAGARTQALNSLAAPGAPYRLLAQEQLAMDQVSAGKTDEAIKALQALLQDADATPGLRRRVTRLIVALGGDPVAQG